MSVAVKNKPPVVVPPAALRQAGFKDGQRLEFRVSRKKVTIVAREQDEYMPAGRRGIEKMLAQSDKDRQAGRTYGPFTTAEEMAASMEGNIRKLRSGRRKTKSAR